MKYRILALFTMFVVGGAFATDHTGDFDVTASVDDECLFVEKSDLAFGTYSPFDAGVLDQAGSVTVKCTNTTGYSVQLGAGNNESGGDRRMVHDTDTEELLGYSLFQNTERTTAWGIGAANSKTEQVGNGSNQAHSIFGRIAAGQNVKPGSFSDTVAVTVVIDAP